MRLIKLNVQDRAFDKVISALKQFPEDEIEILEDVKTGPASRIKKFNAVSLKTSGFRFNRDEANAR
ncbi:MAG TPA: hypothetical protein PK986_03365 [Spirochaetota bacterium]|nr:hypothetical protein [Spirochaetota bacterium]HQO39487.1 hypothetical protein [Spirochaetota bacterium]